MDEHRLLYFRLQRLDPVGVPSIVRRFGELEGGTLAARHTLNRDENGEPFDFSDPACLTRLSDLLLAIRRYVRSVGAKGVRTRCA